MEREKEKWQKTFLYCTVNIISVHFSNVCIRYGFACTRMHPYSFICIHVYPSTICMSRMHPHASVTNPNGNIWHMFWENKWKVHKEWKRNDSHCILMQGKSIRVLSKSSKISEETNECYSEHMNSAVMLLGQCSICVLMCCIRVTTNSVVGGGRGHNSAVDRGIPLRALPFTFV